MADVTNPSRKSPRKSPAKTPMYVPRAEMQEAMRVEDASNPMPQSVLWFEEYQTDDRVRIQREDDRIKKWINHGYLSPEECTDERVAVLWGGGKYWGTLLRVNDKGVEQGANSTRRILPGPYNGTTGMVGLKTSTPAATGNTGIMGRIPEGVDVKTFLDNVILARSLDALERKEPAPVPVAVAPSHSIMDQLLVALLPSAPKLLEAWINRKPVVDPIIEVIKELRAEMAAVKNAPTPAAAAMTDQVKAIKELVALSELLKGGSGDGGGDGEKGAMWGMATKLLEALTARGGAAMAQPPMPGQPQMIEAGAPSPLPLWHQWLLHYADQLVAAARRGMDPEYLAEMVTNLLPQDEEGILIEFLAKVNAEQLACDVVPVLREFPTWTAALVTALREEMKPDIMEESDVA